VTSQGEPLARPERELLAATWRSPVCEVYTLSECGGVAATCVGGELHVCDDTIIVEPVDAEGRPVAPGEPAAKWYLTNLYNATLPLIRYEVDDPVTLGAGTCACGSAHRTLTVGDRGSDTAAVADQAPGRPARRPAGGDVAAPAAREASHVR
jgi:phenylacetate-coenzyme A ligase PaaK-like adenylate-forming protein